MSVVTSCAATAVANRPATRALASAALGPMMSHLFISFSSWPRKSVPAHGRRLSHRITPQSIGAHRKLASTPSQCVHADVAPYRPFPGVRSSRPCSSVYEAASVLFATQSVGTVVGVRPWRLLKEADVRLRDRLG